MNLRKKICGYKECDGVLEFEKERPAKFGVPKSIRSRCNKCKCSFTKFFPTKEEQETEFDLNEYMTKIWND